MNINHLYNKVVAGIRDNQKGNKAAMFAFKNAVINTTQNCGNSNHAVLTTVIYREILFWGKEFPNSKLGQTKMQQEILLEEAKRRLIAAELDKNAAKQRISTAEQRLKSAELDKNEAKQRLNTAEQRLNTLIETNQIPSYFPGSKTEYSNSLANSLNNAQAALIIVHTTLTATYSTLTAAYSTLTAAYSTLTAAQTAFTAANAKRTNLESQDQGNSIKLM